MTAYLAGQQIIAEGLRVDQTSLEDAYLELTRRSNQEQRGEAG